jgi:hypothetical protein
MRHSSYIRTETPSGFKVREEVHVLEQRVGDRLAAQCFVIYMDLLENSVNPRNMVAHQLLSARRSIREFIRSESDGM